MPRCCVMSGVGCSLEMHRSISCITGWSTSALERPEHEALRAAYLADAVVVTPNPRVHALYADKRNLSLLSDQAALRVWGLPAEMLADLAGGASYRLVAPTTRSNSGMNRKHLFFKPAGGYGSKAVYRGDKVTKGGMGRHHWRPLRRPEIRCAWRAHDLA